MRTEQTLRNHYDHLNDADVERWSEMNVYLAKHNFTRGNDGLSYFKRSVLGSPHEVDLRFLPWFISDALQMFLGFSRESILTNKVPSLPAVCTPAEQQTTTV